jgi:hypothetical protein
VVPFSLPALLLAESVQALVRKANPKPIMPRRSYKGTCGHMALIVSQTGSILQDEL